jgi:hypothetical protein
LHCASRHTSSGEAARALDLVWTTTIGWPCHGQTLRHRPVASPAASVLIGRTCPPRRRRGVIPSHVHLPPPVPDQDSLDAALAAGGGLPPRYSHGSISIATKARSCNRIEDHTNRCHLQSTWSLSMSAHHFSPSRNQVPTMASTLPFGYEDDQSPTRMPVFD